MSRKSETDRELCTAQKIRRFRNFIYAFYARNRRSLPWRNTRDPYRILVSEIMLQQTQVVRVLEKYKKFIKVFPTVKALANAEFADVVRVWRGLGYNRRALALKRTAETIVQRYNGIVPRDAELLAGLPGIGKTTARAICAFAFNQPTVFVETNIRSVFIHYFFNRECRVADDRIITLVGKTLDVKDPRAWYSALMDYGAYLKKLFENPCRRSTRYHIQSPFEGSDRQIRGLVLKILVSKKSGFTEAELIRKIGRTRERVKPILYKLTDEGLIRRREGRLIL